MAMEPCSAAPTLVNLSLDCPLCSVASDGCASTAASSGAGGFPEREALELGELFELGAALGEGSFGAVQRGRCRRTGQELAVKVLRREDPEHCVQLAREASMLRSLNHPGVVRAFDSMDDCLRTFLAMELCQGGNLTDAIAKNRGSKCSDAEAKHLFRQVADVVSYLHSAHLVHRDLKLDNFVIKDAGSSLAECTIKLVDFGFATFFTPGPASLRTKCGSSFYMAPEVYFRDSYDEKADIWSCGVILFCMVCGYMPFDGKNLQQVMENVKTKPPSQLAGGISLSARQLIGRLLCKVPESRWSAKQVAESSWLRGTATSPSSSARTQGMCFGRQVGAALVVTSGSCSGAN